MRRMDIAPFTFEGTMRKLQPVTTEPGHIVPASASGGAAKESSALRTAYEVKPDGNAVSVEREMKKEAETEVDYELATNMYKQSVGLIKTALGEAGGA